MKRKLILTTSLGGGFRLWVGTGNQMNEKLEIETETAFMSCIVGFTHLRLKGSVLWYLRVIRGVGYAIEISMLTSV